MLKLIDIPLPARVARLNKSFANATAREVLEVALDADQSGKIAMVSSFGADSVVLLHMLSEIDKNAPVLFLDTEMLFPETLRYQGEVADSLGLSNVQIITPDRAKVFAKDTDGLLHRSDTTSCCDLRKTQPLRNALTGYAGWITGRKRYQSAGRADMDLFENEAGQRIKINPLATWSTKDLSGYIETHRLPRHPLVARGFLSIGCAPCTHPVGPGDDIRSGRWKDQDQSECGIHLVDGRLVRTAQFEKAKAS